MNYQVINTKKCSDYLKQRDFTQLINEQIQIQFQSASQYQFTYINKNAQALINLDLQKQQEQNEDINQKNNLNNQTKIKNPLIHLSNLRCLYNQQQAAVFMCTNILCEKYPFICQYQPRKQSQTTKQQCQCKKDHYSCKLIKSQTIIKQIKNKIQKPIRKQYIKYWLSKKVLWEYMLNIISQERQIIYQLYQNLKCNNNINDIYIYHLQYLDNCLKCYDKKIITQQQYESKKYHQNCSCKPQPINFKQKLSTQKQTNDLKFIQNTFTLLKTILTQYNQLFNHFQIIFQQLQNQLIKINMNPFQQIIYSNLIGQSKSSLIVQFIFSGYIIQRARQYKYSYYHQKKFIQQTSLQNLLQLWKNNYYPHFYQLIQGQIFKKIMTLTFDQKIKCDIPIWIILKRLKFFKNDIRKNENNLVSNYFLLNKRKNLKPIKIGMQYMTQLSKQNFFQIYYNQNYSQNFNFLRQNDSFQQKFQNLLFLKTKNKQNQKIIQQIKKSKFEAHFLSINEKYCPLSFLSKKEKLYYPPHTFYLKNSELDNFDQDKYYKKLNKIILQKFQQIYCLNNLKDNQITEDQQQKFQKIFKTIQNLDLNSIKKKYLLYLNYPRPLKRLKTIVIQKIQDTSVTQQQLKQLYQNLSKTKKLQQIFCEKSSEQKQIHQIIKQNYESIKKVTVKLKLTQNITNFLKKFKYLNELNLYQNIVQFFNSDLNFLSETLKNLYIYEYQSINSKINFQTLSSLKNLERISLHFSTGKPQVNESAIKSLLNLKKLTSVSISQSHISGQILRKITQLQNLQILTLDYMYLKASDIFYIVINSKKLQSLEISFVVVKQQCTQQINTIQQNQKIIERLTFLNQEQLNFINANVLKLQLHLQKKIFYDIHKKQKQNQDKFCLLNYFDKLSRLSTIKIGFSYFERQKWFQNKQKQIKTFHEKINSPYNYYF